MWCATLYTRLWKYPTMWRAISRDRRAHPKHEPCVEIYCHLFMQLLEQVELHGEYLDSVAPLGLQRHFTINWYQQVPYNTVQLIHNLPLFVTQGGKTFDFAIGTYKNTPISSLFSIFYSTGLCTDWKMQDRIDDSHGYPHYQSGFGIILSYMILYLCIV